MFDGSTSPIRIASLLMIGLLVFATAYLIPAQVGADRGTPVSLGSMSYLVGKDLSRLSIGIGMIPRGEVGLIFAGIGLGLAVNGEWILDEAVFSAILVMVMVTTIVTPPLLQWSFSSRRAPGDRRARRRPAISHVRGEQS